MHAALRDEVFEPCGMTHSYLAYRDDPQLGSARRPEAEVWVDDLACLTSGLDLSFDWGGGGIVSTVTDLSEFLQALLAGRLFKSSETIKAMTGWTVPVGLQRPRTGVGLGLFRIDGPRGELWGHSGAWGGKMFHDPGAGLFFAGTANQASTSTDWYYPFIGNVVDWLEGSL
jgi:D-alanyl-D-alanine carboxypeptidase